MKTFLKTVLITLVLVGLVAGSAAWYMGRGSAQAATFRTVPVKRGDLVASISATGTLEPEEVVDVGAQVAGQILYFGKDKSGKPIDYGSAVEEDTVLAQIDDSLYAADVAQNKATLDLGKAGVQRAEADLGQMKAKLYQAERDWDRAQKLGPSDALAQTQYDAYQSAYETAKANLAVGDAAIVQAKNTVSQAEANLQRAQRNLSYCTIKSPVKGVIVDRRVNIGQTVVSSLNAPSLFLIAKDLTRIQVWVSVNEADIGNIHPGQVATFTVDAFPGKVFRGTVNKVRLNATMTQNVVTYTVEVTTDNSDGKLLPYLTANVQFEVSRENNVLMVPNAALRWLPQGPQIAPDARTDSDGPPASTRPTRSASSGEPGEAAQTRGTLWTPEGAFVKPIRVHVGMSDGSMTEISGKELQEGMQIVVNEVRSDTAENASGGTNPFTPQLGRARSSASVPPRPGQ